MTDTTPQIIKDALNAAKAAGEEFFMGLPDRWYESPGPKWRCENGHVTTMYLKSERLGYNACLAGGCNKPVFLTCPEDGND